MKKFVIALVSVFIIIAFSWIFINRAAGSLNRQNLVEKKISVGSLERAYFVFKPTKLEKDKAHPLVFVFHGGGGTALRMGRFTGFSELAEKEKFLVVYPQGIGRNWNDGRQTDTTRAHRENIDDLGFIRQVIEEMSNEYKIDKKRIFATGPSNGGIFSHYVGANLSESFAAIAPVIGGIADPFHKRFAPKEPVSVFVIQGTEDSLVPYDGKQGIGFGRRRNRGRIISTDEAIRLWTSHNNTEKEPITGNLPDTDSNDGCTVESFSWKNGKGNTEVKLFKLIGGGHTWPGGRQYLPRRIIGNTCRDFDAADEIWKFFNRHPKP